MIKDCPKRTPFLTQPANLESSTTPQEAMIGAGITERAAIAIRTEIADVEATRPRVTEREVERAMGRAVVEVAATKEGESTVVSVVEVAVPREEVVLRVDVTEVPAPAEADDRRNVIISYITPSHLLN
jgi:hypothetical protein